MKKTNYLLAIILLMMYALVVSSITYNSYYKEDDTNSLYLDLNTIITPIIENVDEPMKDRYIRTIKVHYKDYLEKPIILQNGDKLYNRCSYQSLITFYSETDSLKIVSTQRMSCEIVAFFNFNNEDITWLKANDIDKIRINNMTTNYNFLEKNPQPDYLKNLLTLYNEN